MFGIFTLLRRKAAEAIIRGTQDGWDAVNAMQLAPADREPLQLTLETTEPEARANGQRAKVRAS